MNNSHINEIDIYGLLKNKTNNNIQIPVKCGQSGSTGTRDCMLQTLAYSLYTVYNYNYMDCLEIIYVQCSYMDYLWDVRCR